MTDYVDDEGELFFELLPEQLQHLFRAIATGSIKGEPDDLARLCDDLAPVFTTEEQTAHLRAKFLPAGAPVELTPRLIKMMCVGHANTLYRRWPERKGPALARCTWNFGHVVHALFYYLDSTEWDLQFWAAVAMRQYVEPNPTAHTAEEAMEMRQWAERWLVASRKAHSLSHALVTMVHGVLDLARAANPGASYAHLRGMSVLQLVKVPEVLDAVTDAMTMEPDLITRVRETTEQFLEFEKQLDRFKGLEQLKNPPRPELDHKLLWLLLVTAHKVLPTWIEFEPWLLMYTWVCNEYTKGKLDAAHWPKPEAIVPCDFADRRSAAWARAWHGKQQALLAQCTPAPATPVAAPTAPPPAIASPDPRADASSRAMAQLLAEEEAADARQRAKQLTQQRRQQRKQGARAARQAAQRAAEEARRAAEQQRAAEEARREEEERTRRREAWRAEREAYEEALAQRAAQLALEAEHYQRRHRQEQREQQEQQPLEGEAECVICMDAPPTTRCQPCKHKVMCVTCAKDWLSCHLECPYCMRIAYSFTEEEE